MRDTETLNQTVYRQQGRFFIQEPHKILLLLFFANLLNVYDRLIPAVIAEPMRKAFGLTDLHVGLIGTAFTVVYALAGIPLGRLADVGARSKVIGGGLIVWSGFTGLTAASTGFYGFLLARLGVGIGEAACAPAANSLISDMYPENRRSRAVGLFMLGLPIGTVLAFVTVGGIASAWGSWRAPFIVAAVPGVLLGILFWFVRDPIRGGRPNGQGERVRIAHPVKAVLAIPTMRWIIVTGIGYNFAAYAVGTFIVPLIQRYHGRSLEDAAMISGGVIGLTGLLALTVGGRAADMAHGAWNAGRLKLCAVALLIASALTGLALKESGVMIFAVLFAGGWFSAYFYIVCVYPTVQELVVPELRATAMAVFFAAFYLCGASFGSVAVGALSDHYALAAQISQGAPSMTDLHRAVGLRDALFVVPFALLVAAWSSVMAARSYRRDISAVSAEVEPFPVG